MPEPDADEPPTLSFTSTRESMRAFALAGLEETAVGLGKLQGDPAERVKLQEAFGANDHLVGAELNEGKLRAATNRRFLPLPVLKTATKNTNSFFLSFFRPKFRPKTSGGGLPDQCDFDVVMVSKDRKSTIGFSIERGRRAAGAHSYTHVQLRRSFDDCPVETTLADEYALSYPAWPVRCRLVGDTWLATLVTLYGLSGNDSTGLAKVIAHVEEGRLLTHGQQMLNRARFLFDVSKAAQP